MKNGVLVCLLVLTFSVAGATPAGATPAPAAFEKAAFEKAPFEKARRLGEGRQRAFFMFSTSIGKYTIRHDGMGEISSKKTHLFFHLRVGTGGRLEQVYFYEYQGDVLLLYEVSGGTVYLARMNQHTRKHRWVTQINTIGPCTVEDNMASCDDSATIDLKTGAEIKTTSSPSSSSWSSPTRGSASSASAREHPKAA
jgi:hypothetical protein